MMMIYDLVVFANLKQTAVSVLNLYTLTIVYYNTKATLSDKCCSVKDKIMH